MNKTVAICVDLTAFVIVAALARSHEGQNSHESYSAGEPGGPQETIA
jgi:hypothetical protein